MGGRTGHGLAAFPEGIGPLAGDTQRSGSLAVARCRLARTQHREQRACLPGHAQHDRYRRAAAPRPLGMARAGQRRAARRAGHGLPSPDEKAHAHPPPRGPWPRGLARRSRRFAHGRVVHEPFPRASRTAGKHEHAGRAQGGEGAAPRHPEQGRGLRVRPRFLGDEGSGLEDLRSRTSFSTTLASSTAWLPASSALRRNPRPSGTIPGELIGSMPSKSIARCATAPLRRSFDSAKTAHRPETGGELARAFISALQQLVAICGSPGGRLYAQRFSAQRPEPANGGPRHHRSHGRGRHRSIVADAGALFQPRPGQRSWRGHRSMALPVYSGTARCRAFPSGLDAGGQPPQPPTHI